MNNSALEIPTDTQNGFYRREQMPDVRRLERLAHEFAMRWAGDLEKASAENFAIRTMTYRFMAALKAAHFGKENPEEKRPLAPGLPAGARLITAAASLKKGGLLFSGNPLLLLPIESILNKKYPIRRLRHAGDWKSLIGALKNGEIPAILPAGPFVRTPAALKSFIKEGRDWLPELRPILEEFYQGESSRLMSYYAHLLSILKKVSPNAVVVDEDATEHNRALVLAAKSLKIRTWVVMHGLPSVEAGFLPLAADFMASWGKEETENLVRLGAERKKFVQTGCAKYDSLCSQVFDSAALKKQSCRDFGWDASKSLVLVIAGGTRTNPLECYEVEGTGFAEAVQTVENFLRAAKEFPDINFIYKFRMSAGDAAIYRRFEKEFSAYPNFRVISKGLAPKTLMASADLVVASTSSAVLEATLIRRPVAIMKFAPDYYEHAYPFLEVTGQGIGEAHDYAQLTAILEKLSKGTLDSARWLQAQEKLIEAFLLDRDGRSAQRVAQAIEASL